MRKTFFLFLAFAVSFSACRNDYAHTFIVGNTTDKTHIQTTEGIWQSVKIDTYVENLPSAASLTWDEVRGLQGDWGLNIFLDMDNTDPQTMIQIIVGDKVAYSLKFSKEGSVKRVLYLPLKNMQGEAIKIQALSYNCKIAAQLNFLH